MSFVAGARDWGGNGRPISSYGANTEFELHHIFPKAVLAAHGVSDPEINCYANRVLLVRETNRGFSDTPPVEYMPEVARNYPDALESQWVSNNPELWKVENYQAFLAERKCMLAEAANKFLESLAEGNLPATVSSTAFSASNSDEEDVLAKLNDFVTANGLEAGELYYQVFDGNTGDLVATLDLAWPNGLKDGLSDPVTVLIGEDDSVGTLANKFGFRRVYTSEEDFKDYVRREILGDEDEDDEAEPT